MGVAIVELLGRALIQAAVWILGHPDKALAIFHEVKAKTVPEK